MWVVGLCPGSAGNVLRNGHQWHVRMHGASASLHVLICLQCHHLQVASTAGSIRSLLPGPPPPAWRRQCAFGTCCRSFHVLCGRAAGQQLTFRATDGEPLAFCELHSRPAFEQMVGAGSWEGAGGSLVRVAALHAKAGGAMWLGRGSGWWLLGMVTRRQQSILPCEACAAHDPSPHQGT